LHLLVPHEQVTEDKRLMDFFQFTVMPHQ